MSIISPVMVPTRIIENKNQVRYQEHQPLNLQLGWVSSGVVIVLILFVFWVSLVIFSVRRSNNLCWLLFRSQNQPTIRYVFIGSLLSARDSLVGPRLAICHPIRHFLFQSQINSETYRRSCTNGLQDFYMGVLPRLIDETPRIILRQGIDLTLSNDALDFSPEAL